MNVLDSFKLNGKVAVVTGGAGKYGYQIVEALAEAGATVYVASRNRENNEKKLFPLTEAGYDVRVKEFDLEDYSSIEKLCEDVYLESGKVDILVNNAVLRSVSGYGDTTDAIDRSMRANGTALIHISRLFGDRMAARGMGGSIINIGSYMGILGVDYNLYEGTDMCQAGAAGDYFFHKGGITNYTRFLASHYGAAQIRSNCVELGGLFNYQHEKFLENYCKKTPLGRMANSTDLKGLIVYLASDASAYMTGAIIPLDGGYSIK
jgi:NAD(P)-dependent dehydrogenase (short-subunit alcohol dehydrogenase family)